MRTFGGKYKYTMRIITALALLGSLWIPISTAAQAPLNRVYEESIHRYYEMAEKGQPDSALYYLNRALEILPDAETNYLLHGLKSEHFLAKGDTATALHELSVAISLKPTELALLEKRGEVLTLSGRYTEALHDYDAILRISPDRESARYNRALVKQALNLLEGAERDLEKIILNNPKAYLPRLTLAGVYLSMEDSADKAEKIYNYLIATYPDIPEAYRHRAQLYLNQDRKALATKDVSKIFELGKDITYRDYLLRGAIRLKYGDEKEALRDFRMAQSMGGPKVENLVKDIKKQRK